MSRMIYKYTIVAKKKRDALCNGEADYSEKESFIKSYGTEYWNHSKITYPVEEKTEEEKKAEKESSSSKHVEDEIPDIIPFMITISNIFPSCDMIDSKGYRFENKVVSMILGLIHLAKDYCGSNKTCGTFTNKDIHKLFLFLDDSFRFMPNEGKKRLCTCSKDTLIYICRMTLSWIITSINHQ